MRHRFLFFAGRTQFERAGVERDARVLHALQEIVETRLHALQTVRQCSGLIVRCARRNRNRKITRSNRVGGESRASHTSTSCDGGP